jgi:hypothetical protein
MNTQQKLADALRGLADHADAASTLGRFADGIGSELDALEAAREALAEHDNTPAPPVGPYTVNHAGWNGITIIDAEQKEVARFRYRVPGGSDAATAELVCSLLNQQHATKVAVFVRRGFVEQVAATVPFEYEVIDADEHDQDPDETETARQRWSRVTKGWVCP